MQIQPRCLLDVIDRNQTYDVVSWSVRLPSGANSGEFMCREDALEFAKREYPALPEDC